MSLGKGVHARPYREMVHDWNVSKACPVFIKMRLQIQVNLRHVGFNAHPGVQHAD